jgi:hypothetical protein
MSGRRTVESSDDEDSLEQPTRLDMDPVPAGQPEAEPEPPSEPDLPPAPEIPPEHEAAGERSPGEEPVIPRPDPADPNLSRRPRTRRAAGAPPGRGGRPKPPGAGGRDLLGRRLVALGIAAIILILIVVAFKGCLNARKERGFENYARDLEGIIAQSKQLSTDFFTQIGEPDANTTELSFEAQVASDRGTAENLADRVANLNSPGELSGAQSELVLTFQLRRDALADIADQLKPALGGGQDATAAKAKIASDMKSFLASDVVYERARKDIIDEFTAQDLATVNGKPIEDVVGGDSFLPALDGPINWIDPLDVSSAISAVAGGTGAASAGVHGVALLQTTLNPGGVILTPDTPVNFTSEANPELEVQVQNQGDTDEKAVTVTVSGAGENSDTIPTLKAGATETATVPVELPAAGETASFTVTVAPVNGEQLTDNNESTYQVTVG